jgi:ATP-dependent 26S proteasome regulatory subunit
VHNSRIRRHRDLPISVYNKSTWTLFMDRFDREQFKNVILVMTSNKPKSYFDELDPAYLRPGRIDLVFDIEEVKKKCE